MPRGLRDLIAYGLSYSAQLDAYLFLLTDVYPDSNPLTALSDLPVRAEDPIELEINAGLERSRLTVFFRLLLAIPHLIWLTLWALPPTWPRSSTGSPPSSTASRRSRCTASWPPIVRYQNHVYAYLFLIADPFPGFTGQAGSYPVDVSHRGPAPAKPLEGVLPLCSWFCRRSCSTVLMAACCWPWPSSAGLPVWSMAACLSACATPARLRCATAAQTNGYVLLLTEAYPYSGPVAHASLCPPRAGVVSRPERLRCSERTSKTLNGRPCH